MERLDRAVKCSGWLCACMMVSTVWGVFDPTASVWAQTPYSQGRQCGMPGGPSCPPPPPIITPWVWSGYSPSSGGPFYSEADAQAWWVSIYDGVLNPPNPGGWACAIQSTTDAPSSWPSGPVYTDGIETGYYTSVTLVLTKILPNPTCTSTATEAEVFQVSRSFYCPVGLTLHYQASPVIGPYCGQPPPPPPPVANLLKASGNSCPVGCGGTQGTNQGAADAGAMQTTQANPVNASNGNKYEAETDYVGVGNNPLKFVRSYNSLISYLLYGNSSLKVGEQFTGAGGWNATYFQYLLPVSVTDSTTTYNTVYAYRPDGRLLTFYEYQGVYSPDGDVADRLMQTSSGWEYQTADDTIETYNSAGQLISIATRGQAPVTVNYNAGSGLGDPPVSVSDAFGHSLQFSYAPDPGGVQRLASITDPAGHTISYSYDQYGRLTSVTYADSTTRKYGYTNSTNGWLLTTLTDEAAVQYATWTYAGSGAQVLSSQHAGGVEAYSFSYSTYSNGTISSVLITDPLGENRTYPQQLVWGVNRTTGASALCSACGEDASRSLDADGNITARTDFNGNQTTYVYNTTNNLETSRTEAYGTSLARTITTRWDANWREPDLITEPNCTTARTYDGMGNILTKTITDTTVTPNVTRTWTYTYDSYGRMLTAKGPRTDVNSTSTYTYYSCTTGTQCGEIETIQDALGHTTTFNNYNAHGQPLTITDSNGTVTTLTYDKRLRLLSRQVGTETTSYSYYPTGLFKQVTLADGSYVVYTYDNAHRLTQITDGAGNYISYTLDNMGNRTAMKTYDPSGTLHRTHTRAFNSLNELYQDVNAAGTSAVTTTYGYDSNGNQTSIDAPLSRDTSNQFDALNHLSQVTDPNSGVIVLSYDANDNLASVKDPRSLTTSYSHNGFGDLAQLVSPDTGTTTNTYDSGGNLKTATDARSALATYSYDVLNRLTQMAYSDNTINLTYDSGTNGVGRLTGASDNYHSLSWTYDALGRVNGKGQTVAGVTKSVGYSYTNGDLVILITPSGQTVTYSYTNHQITSISINGTTLLSGVIYDPFGPATGWTWGNSSTVSRSYTEDGAPNQIVTAGVTNGYTEDNALRITAIGDSGLSSNSWTFGYDILDRVTSGSSSAFTRGYTYDANGNTLTETGTVAYTASIASTNNRIASSTGGLVRTYSYDAAGDTTAYASNSYTFNQRGRMVSATSSVGTNNYVYNALGQLIEKSGASGTTILMYDEAGRILGEYSSSGALIEETIWMGDLPVATLQPNGSGISIYYVHSDHLNTPRKVTRPSDNSLMWRWDPDTFGSVGPNQNPSGNGTFSYNLRFPGQYYQAETGLNYNYFRDYDPQTGRYVESDPMGLDAGINTYAYVGGNPLSREDPSGLCAIDLQQLIQNAKLGTLDPDTYRRRTKSIHDCANTVRYDLFSAGGPLLPRLGANGTPSPAAWGPTLISSGCYQLVANNSAYVPQVGDIAIAEGTGTSHVSIYDGSTWDADIAKPNPIPNGSPTSAYGNAKVTIYQYVGQH